MANDDLIEVLGVVTASNRDIFTITLDEDGREVAGHISGKLRTNSIRILVGDRVTVAISPYDLGRGRITFRHK